MSHAFCIPSVQEIRFAWLTLAGVHDETYKRIFAFPRMVEDLLRGFVGGEWLEEVDLRTLEKLSSEFVADELLKRRGDTAWRVQFRGGWLYLLVLLEFQSRVDSGMALRILTYTGLIYQELIRNRGRVAGGLLPPVLPIVLYNGERPWTAPIDVRDLIAPVGPALEPYQPTQRYRVVDERHIAGDDLPWRNLMATVIRLEASRSPKDLEQVVDALREALPDPSDAELRSAFAEWIWRALERLAPGSVGLPPAMDLEEVRMSLLERVSEWPREWLQEGIRQGVAQGLEQQRALLERLAAGRFGASVGADLRRALGQVEQPDQLAQVGDWILQSPTAGELLRRASTLTKP